MIDEKFFNEWSLWCLKQMLSIDVSDLKDGEIKNINGRESVEGDLGVDNKREGYWFIHNEWRKLKD